MDNSDTATHKYNHLHDKRSSETGRFEQRTNDEWLGDDKGQEVADMIRAGKSCKEIMERLHVGPNKITKVRKSLGLTATYKNTGLTRKAVIERRELIRQLAREGYTSDQAAQKIGITKGGCQHIARTHSIVFNADKSVSFTRKHDSNRIVETIVMDAENLTADANLINFKSLQHDDVVGWVASLKQSRKKLGEFIRQLNKETKQDA